MIWVLLAIILLFGFVVFFGAPYVPSKKAEAKQALDDLYPLGEGDTLVDIGSGDGVVLRIAADKGARAVGYEINPLLVVLSWWLSRRNPLVSICFRSYWGASFPPDTTVVYTFGDSRDIARMADKVRSAATELGRPLAFISYAVAVPDLEPKSRSNTHYLYEIEPLQLVEA